MLHWSRCGRRKTKLAGQGGLIALIQGFVGRCVALKVPPGFLSHSPISDLGLFHSERVFKRKGRKEGRKQNVMLMNCSPDSFVCPQQLLKSAKFPVVVVFMAEQIKIKILVYSILISILGQLLAWATFRRFIKAGREKSRAEKKTLLLPRIL